MRKFFMLMAVLAIVSVNLFAGDGCFPSKSGTDLFAGDGCFPRQ